MNPNTRREYTRVFMFDTLEDLNSYLDLVWGTVDFMCHVQDGYLVSITGWHK